MLFTTLSDTEEPRFFEAREGRMSFDIDMVLQGDVYIRCYHFKGRGKKHKFMFRTSIHTGFVPHGKHENVLRLTKTEVDDAIKSSKFDRDFFMDYYFETV
jgi:hypothetical protein